MSWDQRIRRYQKFLKSLKRPESTLCSCPIHIHPRHWVPPPCLTSRAQKEDTLFGHRRTLSNPELRMRSSSSQVKSGDNKNEQPTLQQLYKEARILKEAYSNIKKGDKLNRDSRDVIKKWSATTPRQRSSSETNAPRPDLDPNQQMEEIDRSLAEAEQEETALRQELQYLREKAKNRDAYEEENKKLKKKIRHLQHRIKRQDEAKRRSHESLHVEREMGTREEFILISLKKKYEDLLQYVLKVESENQKLKSLHGFSGDRDEFLHDYDHEASEVEQHSIRRLQRDLDILRNEVMKKDNYITECEEQLQAMQALKEENITLHNSLKNTHDQARQPDPREIGTALEDEWMRRLAETREIYEQAIEGYRDQLLELQDKLQRVEASHASHVEELVSNINELKEQKERSGPTDNVPQDTEGRRGKRTEVNENTLHGKAGDDSGSKESERSSIPKGAEGVSLPGDKNMSETKLNSGSDERVDTGRNIREKVPIQRKEEEDKDDRDTTRVTPSIIRGEASAGRQPFKVSKPESDKTSVTSDEGQRQPLNLQDKDSTNRNRNRQEVYEVEKQDKKTQTSPRNYPDNEEVFRTETDPYRSEISRVERDMLELKENLEKVNHLVKRLESMKLSGEGTDAILSTIRDAISDCLREWQGSFRQQKALQKNSGDENKDFVELQRKLRSKSKQLEAKQKQCKQLEEQNARLTEKSKRLEAKVDAAQAPDRLEMLQDLPHMLHNTEKKLSEFQDAFQRAQEEKASLQEQIKTLMEKLNKKETKLAAEHEQVLTKVEEMKTLQEKTASLKLQLEEGSREISLLKEQLLTKDTILEHTSAQLEERIRECARLSALIERQTEQLNDETRNVQARLNEQESSLHKQFLEVKALASRYQAQLSALQSEKDHNEKSLRQNVRKLQEQVDQLQLRNSTLQRQLNTITSTYHSMFASVEISNPLGPTGTGNANG